jgi:hypothetical protein
MELNTQPRWFALWLDSPLWAELLHETWLILDAAPFKEGRWRAAISEFMTGLNTAFNAGTRLHVTLFPRGSVVDGKWQLVPHCSRCKAEWRDASSCSCKVCGHFGRPAAAPKRMARGQRPYFPLERLLGEMQAAEFLVRYVAFRAGQQSPDRLQSRPPPAPPNSPPAG